VFGLAEMFIEEKNMNFIKITSTALLFTNIALGFGAPDILPATDRSKSYEIITKLDKKKSFQKITIWSAKTFTNANEAIKLKDAELGVIVAKGNLPCEALKIGNGYGKNQRIEFTLEITADNKKTEVKVSDLVGHSDGAYDDGARPSKKEEMDAAVKECVDPFVELIKKELN